VVSQARPAVQVLVLGPVRVRIDGAESVPGGRRERGVLAALVLAGPAGIDHERLVDQLYGPAAPATAHRTTQSYLSRLRTLLGPEVIRTQAGRHRLVADLVDLWEFDRLLQPAREGRANAPESLRAALSLWRDTDVAMDASLEGAAELLAAVRRSRLDALERRALQVDDSEAVDLAEALLAEDPHRERAWAALAMAHYRLGRQSEALAAIREARHRLADDLGVDLSPELDRLEQEMLHHTLTIQVPRPLPGPLTQLVGRNQLVERVVEALRSARLVTLVGTGGIGKTRVALAAAESTVRTAAVPAFLAELSLATTAASVDDVLVESIDAAGEDVEAAFRRRFERLPGLLVLDGCEHVLAAVAGRVTGLLRTAPGLRILATSRAALDLLGERLIDVPTLATPASGRSRPDDAPALRLFYDRAAEVSDVASWSGRERATAADICRALDGLPLAIEVTARRLRDRGLDDLRVDLAAGSANAVATALDASYEALPAPHRRAYARLGLLQGSVPRATAAAVVGDEDAVDALLRASLLHRSSGGVRMYQPVRHHAASKLTPADRRVGRERIADEILALVAAATDHLIGPDELTWLGRIDAVHGDVRGVLEWASKERPAMVPQIAAMVGYLWLLGWSAHEGRRWLDTALDQPTDDPTRARLLTWSTVLAALHGDLERARADGDEAIAIARALERPRVLGAALHARALPDKYAADTTGARDLLDQAWRLRHDSGDLAGAAMSIGAIADIDVNEGRLQDAAERYAVGLPLMRTADTARGLVAYLHSMSELALLSGDPHRALRLVDEAEGAARSTQDTWHLALLASVRAGAARDLRRPYSEQWLLTRAALRAATDQADPRVRLEVVEHLGAVLLEQGRHGDALRLLRGARLIRERTGIGCSVPRRTRRDGDEATAAQHAELPDASIEIDLPWLLAAASEALGVLPYDESWT
jgi:predicted ATPase/DNA-binding SARP family transcriptional activator